MRDPDRKGPTASVIWNLHQWRSSSRDRYYHQMPCPAFKPLGKYPSPDTPTGAHAHRKLQNIKQSLFNRLFFDNTSTLPRAIVVNGAAAAVFIRSFNYPKSGAAASWTHALHTATPQKVTSRPGSLSPTEGHAPYSDDEGAG